MMNWLRRLFGSRAQAPAWEAVQIDDFGVSRTLADGKEEAVKWTDLEEVLIVTTDEGPWFEDVFFLMIGRNETGCVIPQGHPEGARLLNRLQELPGFSNKKVIEAMGCAENARFLCWRRAG